MVCIVAGRGGERRELECGHGGTCRRGSQRESRGEDEDGGRGQGRMSVRVKYLGHLIFLVAKLAGVLDSVVDAVVTSFR